MKKLISVTLALTCMLNLAACGSKDESSGSSSSTATTTEVTSQPTEAETESETSETTTKAPETTTKAPETTTKAPETTTESPDTTEASSDSKDDLSQLDAIGDIAVDTSADEVIITIPAELVSDQSEMIEEARKDPLYTSAVPNDDGSITYTMTKESHQKLLEQMKDEFDSQMTETISGMTTITSVSHNDDMTSFTIHVTDYDSYKSSSDGLIGLSIAMYAAMYGLFSGNQLESMDSVDLHIVDANGVEYDS